MPEQSITSEVVIPSFLEIRAALTLEHQRLSGAIQKLPARAPDDMEEGYSLGNLHAWQAVITLCRESFARNPRTYQDHLRFLALRDAADAIARAAIGEAEEVEASDWEPTAVFDRFDLPHGTVFTVKCDAGFSRKLGSRVIIGCKPWQVLGWDDHKTMGAPHDGEVIAIRVLPLFAGGEA